MKPQDQGYSHSETSGSGGPKIKEVNPLNSSLNGGGGGRWLFDLNTPLAL